MMEPEIIIPMSRPDLGNEEIEEMIKIMRTGWTSQGSVTAEFDNRLSKYLSSNAITVNNGSSALMCALIAHGLTAGDKVIAPTFTFIATSSIPKILGADIIPADIDPTTLNISPNEVERLVKNNRVKAVIIVDVGGLAADIDAFVELSKKYNFILIEDAAESFGAEYKHKKLGAFDHTTIFSFQIAKQLTTIEGGCITTKDEKFLKKISKIKDYGRNEKERYVHDIIGTNFRTTDIQSSIGICQLAKVERSISNRNAIASIYKDEIKDVKFQEIPTYATRHSYMLFFALANNRKERDKYVNELIRLGIDARKSWTPIHMQPCNPELSNMVFKNAEAVFDCAFTLPIYNGMTLEEANKVTEAFQDIQ